MKESTTAINTPKKRGRPAILKQYSDPMKSPMAQSSLQVQKSQQSFNKPLMRIGNSPTKFKTPQRKRRFSAEISPPSSAGSSSKRGRYRGVVINSNNDEKVKQRSNSISSKNGEEMSEAGNQDQTSLTLPSSSAPGTPLEQVFSSISKAHNVKSSPPVMFDSDSPIRTKRKLEVEVQSSIDVISRRPETLANNGLNFMLNVGKYGKATISSSFGVLNSNKPITPPKHLTETPPQITEVDENGVARFDKKRVMEFLRQMKSKNKTLDDKSLPQPSRNFTIPSSPSAPPNSSGEIPEPFTPRCSQVLHFKTGLTPNFNIDELLISPRFNDGTSKQVFKSPGQYVFKVSSGDPLLINDHQETELICGRPQEVSDILSFLNSPKRQNNLNTPPSYLISFQSPRSNTRALSSENVSKHQLSSLSILRSEHNPIPLPSTPQVRLTSATPLSFTPFVQKTGSDECDYRVPNSIHPITLQKNTVKAESGDDARAALKKLINGK